MKKTTIIITGYNVDRINKNKDVIFERYDSLSEYIDKIIFIWNNQKEPMPYIKPLNNVELVKIKASKNSIANRHHIVYPEVNTESALIIDEDIVLDKQCIRDLINKWEKDKEYVIGLAERRYDMFGNYGRGNNVLTIGQTMMYHKKYMKEFANYKDLHTMIDNNDWRHQDDLVFQIMVHSINNKNCTKVVNSRGVIKNLDKSGAVSEVPNWKHKRTKAVRTALKYFNIQPLPLQLYENRYIVLLLIITIIIVLYTY